MKKAKTILKNQLILTVQAGIMALAISVILCMSTMTISVHAFGPDHSYFAIAYLAEKQATLNKDTIDTENEAIIATAKVSTKEKQTRNADDHKSYIPLNKEMRTEQKR